MEKILLENQILIMESNLMIMNSQNNFYDDFKKKLEEQILFSKQYLKILV
jgi:hypothetical protein